MKMPSLTNLAENSSFNFLPNFYSITPSANAVSSVSKKIASCIKVVWSFFTLQCKWIYESLCGRITKETVVVANENATQLNRKIDAQDENGTEVNIQINAQDENATELISYSLNYHIRSLMIDKVSTLFEKTDESDTSYKETSKEFLIENLLNFLSETFLINEEKNIHLETKNGRKREIFVSFPSGTDKREVKKAFYKTEFGIKKFKLSWPDRNFFRNESDEGAMVCRIYSRSKTTPV